MAYSTINTGNYDIFIGDIFPALQQWLDGKSFSSIVILVDENTERFCYPVLREALPSLAKKARLLDIRSGEVHKTLTTCTYLWEKLTHDGTDRNALIINLSGGVLSDMGGFVASTYKRGVRFINLPTTLLSMVDASVGGKLGVDFDGYKNHIGLFAGPAAVFIFPGFLKTLPQQEFKSGMAEVLKHGLIADKSYFREVMGQLEANDFDFKNLVEQSVRIKNKIVSQDPHEKGLRKVLNFGHTVGHAIESWSFESGERLLHGEAIAQGMRVELLLSVQFSGLNKEDAHQAIQYLEKHYGKFMPGNDALDAILEKMHHDKKNNGGHLLFTLLEDIGKAVYDIDVEEKEVYSALEEIMGV